MDMMAVGQSIFLVSAVAALSLPFGFVVLRVAQAWLVDQTLNLGQALLVAGGVIAVLFGTLTLWGSAWMLLPPAATSALTLGWWLFVRGHERAAARQYDSAEERRCLELLERDPRLGAAYERLAALYERQGRLDEALAVLRNLRELTGDRLLDRRIRALQVSVQQRLAPRAAAPIQPPASVE
ncbi:MAG: hypothetical protein IT204_18240 [Fimbriimonadaceae bacterium]|nr:hypothetical protein [Fimbriimonadaceae bacterium]